jgi:chromosome segregation ATPase
MVEDYVTHAAALLGLARDVDERLRRQQASRQQAARRAQEQLERRRRMLDESRARLATALHRAVQEQAIERIPAPLAGDPGSDPVELLHQLVERLERAIDDAAHARQALEAEQGRLREQRRAREQEAQRRRAEAEAQRSAQLRRAHLVDWAWLAAGVVLLVLAVVFAVTGILLAAAPVAGLAVPCFGVLVWRRRTCGS